MFKGGTQKKQENILRIEIMIYGTQCCSNCLNMVMRCRMHTLYGHEVQDAHLIWSRGAGCTPYMVTRCRMHTLYGHEVQDAHLIWSRGAGCTPHMVTRCRMHTLYGHEVQDAHLIWSRGAGCTAHLIWINTDCQFNSHK